MSGAFVSDSGSFNVNRLKEIVPTVQFYSSNPRNSAVNIRGLGAPFGLTNDGIEPGVGFYVDGVFNARPAVATLDFLDVAQIEVLRGPQGTLYGKNTTAGAINITTRRPSFTPDGPAIAHVRPDGFVIGAADAPGIAARVRNVLLAGPDARIDCVLDDGVALEVRISHDDAKRLAPRDRISLAPHTVRVWR